MIRTKRKKTFVLVIPRFEDIFNSFYAGEIIKGVSLAVSRLKADVLIHVTDRGDHRGWLDSSLLDRRFIDGIIFGDIDNDVAVVKKAIQRGIPALILNNYLEEPFNCVAIDNKTAAYEAVQHLIKNGHRKIATLVGDLSTQAGVLRLAGYRQALEEAGIKVPASYVATADFLRTPAREASLRLLRLKNRPTAIFAASDVMALEALDVARRYQISVPEHLSVIGFDDNPLNIASPVRLSTVYQPLVEMGRLGAEQLYQISHGKARLPVKILLGAKLRLRHSTAPCTAKARKE